MADPVALAILARAPIAGAAKTRLIPALGADGAACLAAAMIRATLDTVTEARRRAPTLGQATLWTAPDPAHTLFQDMTARHDVALAAQDPGDLGARMLAAMMATDAPTLVIGTDCPALTAAHLVEAAAALADHDAVMIPARDGGYVLIGSRHPQPTLFSAMPWGTAEVARLTRMRLAAQGLRWREWPALADIDRPADLAFLRGDPRFATVPGL